LTYVKHRIGEEVLVFKGFERYEDAREFARSLWGPGGAADNERALEDDTLLTPMEFWTLHLDPAPELSASGRWIMPGEPDDLDDLDIDNLDNPLW
jgi:hypothetical protein